MRVTEQTYRKVLKEQEKELEKQFRIINGAACMVLWELHGWRKKRITSLACIVNEVWKECADAGVNESMLEKCEKETGIEMMLDGVRSYHEFPYLDHTKWKKYPTPEEHVYILLKERIWIPTMLMACFLIALKRKEHWGFDKLAEFCANIDGIRKEKNNPKYYTKLCKERYDLDLIMT